MKKGDPAKSPGRPKGSIKKNMEKMLTNQYAQEICRTIISGSIAGEDKKIDTILKIQGELNEAPQTQLTVNNNTINTDMIALAQEYNRLKNNVTASSISSH